jgi:hypothetical protein
MHADFSALKKRILDVTQESVLRERIKDVSVEADRDDEGSDFLRVILQVRPLDGVDDAEIEALVESIETAIGDLDERFPSVRIADAA